MLRSSLLPSFLHDGRLFIAALIPASIPAPHGSRAAGDAFWKEFDFVVAGVATCLLANFAAVYLAAPTLGGAVVASGGGSALGRFLAGCPDNAFQTVLAGNSPFSLVQADLHIILHILLLLLQIM